MITPSEIREKVFKTGIGYDKKDVEQFVDELASDYEALLEELTELKKKTKEQSEALAYYKSIEKTLQKALILAEKTAQDTRATALKEADAVILEAKAKADMLLTDSKRQIEVYEHKIMNLMQQYDLYKIHFENLLHGQLELLNSKSFSVNTAEFSYIEGNTSSIHQAQDRSVHQTVAQGEDTMDEVASASEDDININQIRFDFLEETVEPESYQTEDGFEFITLKDE